MPNPRHVNPRPNADAEARAPYNFVPLPEGVLFADTAPPRHDRWIAGTHSGWVDLDIETLTPLFIRGPARRKDDDWDQREARLRPEPFTTPDGRPLIPGSSLRGMLRTLVEILTFAKIAPVSRAQPFYRTVSPGRIGDAYRDRMVRAGSKPRGGFVGRNGGKWTVKPAAAVLRVARPVIGGGFPYRQHPNYHPDWGYQQKRCWVRHDAGDRVTAMAWAAPTEDGWTRGTLVLTGSAPGKLAEFLFLDPGPKDLELEIADAVWDRFHDDDQLTKWQEDAFPRDEPTGGARRAKGHLREGEPVFFVEDGGKVEFLGRAQMFRLPYDLSMSNLLPEEHHGDGLDHAESIFGRVVHRQPKLTVKGRVFIEDSVGERSQHGWMEDHDFQPRILSGPKPTTFSHYLTQDGEKPPGRRTTYLKGDHTTVRGHKLYWHRWNERGLAEVKESPQPGGEPDKQHTVMRPVKAGVTFVGRVRFENLTDFELGALMAALRLPGDCAHKLGMAKPLGLGSVRITPMLRLVDRQRRYRSWSDDGLISADATAATETRCLDAFTRQVLDHARSTGETLLDNAEGLHRVARLDALFIMLRWPSPAEWAQTAYLPKPGDFKTLNVLPSPHGVAGMAEPDWPSNPPRPAPRPGQGGAPAPAGASGRPADPEHRPGPAGPRSRPAGPGRGRPGTPGGRSQAPAPRPAAPIVVAVVLEETTRGGKPIVRLPDGRKAVFQPATPPPADLVAGQEVRVRWFADGDPYGQVRWEEPV